MPQCQNCNVPITVKHFLIECPLYLNERRLWLGNFNNNAPLTMKSLLEDSDNFNINKIINYLGAIQLLDKI